MSKKVNKKVCITSPCFGKMSVINLSPLSTLLRTDLLPGDRVVVSLPDGPFRISLDFGELSPVFVKDALPGTRIIPRPCASDETPDNLPF